MSRIVTVFGATGSQGSGVVNALLAEGSFTPRATTRDETSVSAQELKNKGAEIARVDLSDLDSLKNAIRGSEAVFLVTVPFVQQDEIDQAEKVIQACQETGIKFIVFSSLPDASKQTKGKFSKMYHFDAKARIEERIQASGIPYAFLYTGYFLENVWKYGCLRPNPSNPDELDYRVFKIKPETSLPFSWVEKDVGQSTLALLKHYREKPAEVLGGKFYVLSQRTTVADLMETTGRVLGKKVNYTNIETSGFDPADQTCEFQRDYVWYPESLVPDPRLIALGVKFGTIEEFVRANKERHLTAAGQK
jgi:nucleoside-diphosphate-sugar epimerase